MKAISINMKPIKKSFLSVLFIIAFTGVFAQKVDSVKVISDKQVVMLDKNPITDKTTIEEVIKLLGATSRVEQSAGMDRYYIYDNLGLSFDAGKKGLIEAIYINFNWDQDRKAAQKTFNGVLSMDKYIITDKTISDDIKSKTKVKDIVCLGPTMCMSNPTPTAMALVIGYTKDAKMTQIVFGFTK